MGSQSGYFCVTLYAAAMFIENLTSEQLAIDQELFRSQISLSPDPRDHSTSVDDSSVDGTALNHEKNLEAYMADATPPAISDVEVLADVPRHETHTISHSPLFEVCWPAHPFLLPSVSTYLHFHIYDLHICLYYLFLSVSMLLLTPSIQDDPNLVLLADTDQEASTPIVSNSLPPDHPLQGKVMTIKELWVH